MATALLSQSSGRPRSSQDQDCPADDDNCSDGLWWNGAETCELPNTTDNSFCSQAAEQCVVDTRYVQMRDAYGYCDG